MSDELDRVFELNETLEEKSERTPAQRMKDKLRQRRHREAERQQAEQLQKEREAADLQQRRIVLRDKKGLLAPFEIQPGKQASRLEDLFQCAIKFARHLGVSPIQQRLSVGLLEQEIKKIEAYPAGYLYHSELAEPERLWLSNAKIRLAEKQQAAERDEFETYREFFIRLTYAWAHRHCPLLAEDELCPGTIDDLYHYAKLDRDLYGPLSAIEEIVNYWRENPNENTRPELDEPIPEEAACPTTDANTVD